MTQPVDPLPSFEAIASELSPALRGYLVKMVGSAADADDLLQESLLRIARGLPQFERRSSVRSWAYRIATNVAIDHLRKTKRATFVEFDERHEAADPVSHDDTDRLVIGEMNACIREVIDGLPPDYRAALVLFNLEGRSVAEVADICGISRSLAKVRVHRGKARLKKALEQACDFYESADGTFRCDRKRPQTDPPGEPITETDRQPDPHTPPPSAETGFWGFRS